MPGYLCRDGNGLQKGLRVANRYDMIILLIKLPASGGEKDIPGKKFFFHNHF